MYMYMYYVCVYIYIYTHTRTIHAAVSRTVVSYSLARRKSKAREIELTNIKQDEARRSSHLEHEAQTFISSTVLLGGGRPAVSRARRWHTLIPRRTLRSGADGKSNSHSSVEVIVIVIVIYKDRKGTNGVSTNGVTGCIGGFPRGNIPSTSTTSMSTNKTAI